MIERLIFLIGLLAGNQVRGLFFDVRQGDVKCFVEEVPDDTVVVGKYILEVYDKDKTEYYRDEKIGMHVIVKNPDEEEIMNKVYRDSPGRFAFTSIVPGEHRICIGTDAAWFGNENLRIHLDIAMGEGTNDYDEIRRNDKLDDLQLRIRQVLDQIKQVRKEQEFSRVREMRFRATSQSINTRVIYWSIVQITILV
eukprot:Ihof_evm1s862 gene=Ihof_evmTU1s862